MYTLEGYHNHLPEGRLCVLLPPALAEEVIFSVPSVCVCVCLSVCPSVRLSICALEAETLNLRT